jgi:hypothetical protein
MMISRVKSWNFGNEVAPFSVPSHEFIWDRTKPELTTCKTNTTFLVENEDSKCLHSMITTYRTTRCHNQENRYTISYLKVTVFWYMTPCSLVYDKPVVSFFNAIDISSRFPRNTTTQSVNQYDVISQNTTALTHRNLIFLWEFLVCTEWLSSHVPEHLSTLTTLTTLTTLLVGKPVYNSWRGQEILQRPDRFWDPSRLLHNRYRG